MAGTTDVAVLERVAFDLREAVDDGEFERGACPTCRGRAYVAARCPDKKPGAVEKCCVAHTQTCPTCDGDGEPL